MPKSRFINRLLFFLATRLGWLFILFYSRLTRITYVGREHFLNLKHSGKPFIICVWHGRILLPVFVHRHQNIQVMVSEHRDGEMIARTIRKLGFGTIRGSSTRGGKRASLQMLHALKQGAIAAIMPDGPTGPRHVFKPGAISLASKTGAYLLLLTYASDRYIEFRSWDRFYLWKPFSRSVVMYAEPIAVPPNLEGEDFEVFRKQIEQKMIELERQADAYFRA